MVKTAVGRNEVACKEVLGARGDVANGSLQRERTEC